MASVAYWKASGDLRLYVWVQFMPLVALPVVLGLFRPRYSHQGLLLAALACYVLGKLAETFDAPIDAALGAQLSGHSLKHLLSAAGAGCLVLLLRRRRRLPVPAA